MCGIPTLPVCSNQQQPTGYSQLVEVHGPHRLVFVAGQTGVDAGGKAARGFRAQIVQAYANIRTALASVGGSMDHVVRLTTYVTDIEQNADIYREVRAATFTNKNALPASTLVRGYAPRRSVLPRRDRRHRNPSAARVAAFNLCTVSQRGRGQREK